MRNFIIRGAAATAVSLFLSIQGIFAQSAPTWMTPEMRELDFPRSEYYTGFVGGSLKPGETETTAMQRLKKEAMAEAAASVKVKVENTTSSLLQSLQLKTASGLNEEVRTSFESATKTSTSMELPGLKTDTWRNPQTREVYAFAYTRKADVINYFNKQVTMNLAKLEAKLQTIDQLIDLGQKVQAKKTAESALELLSSIDAAQKMLTAVDPNVTNESLQMTEVTAAARELIGKLVALTQGVKVYVTGLSMSFGQQSSELATKLKALMSADCSFVENEAECDYKITLKGQTREGFNDPNIKFAFVDVAVSVFDAAKQREVYSETLTAKGGHTTWHLAGKEAYNTVAPKVYEAVKPFMK